MFFVASLRVQYLGLFCVQFKGTAIYDNCLNQQVIIINITTKQIYNFRAHKYNIIESLLQKLKPTQSEIARVTIAYVSFFVFFLYF